ncbi:unnamed protein product [Orchesella dallaii]|uniref:Uncharacterized protein n=1 Tax=Orchesella dallaii TaxID=48710 RepID=A0ABP1PU90_9HEXA
MDNPPPKSWDDYEDDLFADAAKRMQGMTGFRDRYRPSWWPSRGRSVGWNTGLYRSNYGPPVEEIQLETGTQVSGLGRSGECHAGPNNFIRIIRLE